MRGMPITSEVRFSGGEDGVWEQPKLEPKKRQKQPKMGYEYNDSRNFGNTFF
jgi:hypothetical protein